jgi:hypothetical protein
MKLAKSKAKANKTFIVKVSLMILTYDRQNTFTAHATVYHHSITQAHHRIITPAMILTNDETFQNISFHSAASSLAFLFVKCNKTFVEKY